MHEAIIMEIRCNSPMHKRIPWQPCKKHLFNLTQDGDVITISKRCPDCKTENTLTIVTGRVRPPSAKVMPKEDAYAPVEQKSLTARQS